MTFETSVVARPGTIEEVPMSLKGKNIMIVEDVISNFQLLVAYLSPLGANIIHEAFGLPAIETLKRRNDINLILMDLLLPDIHGLEVAKKIREFDNEVPIIAQTAFAMYNDKKNCIDAGCDDYIAKPIRRNDFLEIITKYC
ncbi:MAG: response regulator [Bacteroidales bacterium]|nr:response regulator [Bacteroidales bacterium]